MFIRPCLFVLLVCPHPDFFKHLGEGAKKANPLGKIEYLKGPEILVAQWLECWCASLGVQVCFLVILVYSQLLQVYILVWRGEKLISGQVLCIWEAMFVSVISGIFLLFWV